MMRVVDSLVLARTKLKVHRIRTWVTVVTSGLLFGLTVAVIVITQGAFSSVERFSTVGLNDRSILAVSYFPSTQPFNLYDHLEDESFIAEIETLHTARLAELRAIAKKHQIDFVADVELPSPVIIDPITKKKSLGVDAYSNTIVQEVIARRIAAEGPGFSIETFTAPYDSAILRGTSDPIHVATGAFGYMKEGIDPLIASFQQLESANGGESTTLALLDGSITQPFLSGDTFDPAKGEIPVILPLSDAEKLLGLEPLKSDAGTQAKYDRLVYIRDNVHRATAAFCYRNAASSALLETALAQEAEKKRLAGSTDYVKPQVTYAVPPADSCGPVETTSDTRTQFEKDAQQRRIAYEKEAGIWQGEPAQQKIIVRGVGVSGDSNPYGAMGGIDMFVTSLLNSHLGYSGWAVPSDLLAQVPAQYRPNEVFSPVKEQGPYQYMPQQLVEFSDPQQARDAMKAVQGTEVSAYPFGSGTLFIDELKSFVQAALLWTLLVIGVIAALIMWGVIARTVSDSRRESAVFRAIGATRFHIAQIYGTYTVLLSLRVVAAAGVIGLAAGAIVHFLYAPTITLAAKLAYASADPSIRFDLVSLESPLLLLVAGAIVGVGIIASIIPIASGARRNPITDMRDDA